MVNEKRACEIVNSIIAASPSRLNKYLESDSEILALENARYLFTTDEFSSEDMFRDKDPYALGWNIAIGGISDILATGGTPLFYAHAMVIDNLWDEDFIKMFCRGIADVLKKSGATFIGGDFGRSQRWRYTASIIGRLDGKPILRRGASEGDVIFISGRIGAGNLDAALKLYSAQSKIGKVFGAIKNRFHLRISEAKLIREYATACIDTSDGVFNALNTICDINSKGYEVENLPYLKQGLMFARLASLPKILLFLGECGEYELLFTIKEHDEEGFLKRSREEGHRFYRLGRIIPPSDRSRAILEGEKRIDLSNLKNMARDYDDVRDYLESLIEWLKVHG